MNRIKMECICPYGDRCKELANIFSTQCTEAVASARGGYVEIPPADMDHLEPSPIFSTTVDLLSPPEEDTESGDPPPLKTWEQIRRAYIHYFQILTDEGGSTDDDSVLLGDDEPKDNTIAPAAGPEKLCVALHHFHPKITTPMRKRQQAWDKTPVWQCLNSSSLVALMQGEDPDMIKQIVNKSNRLKVGGNNLDMYGLPSYVVLPSYPIERAERDAERLKLSAEAAAKQNDTKAEEKTNGASANESADEKADGSQPETEKDAKQLSMSMHARMSKEELHEYRKSYHEKLLSFERMRRAAADERLQYLWTEWLPQYETMKELIAEFHRIDALIRSSWRAIDNYTKALQSLSAPTSSADIFEGVVSSGDAIEILDPLATAFSSVANDWQEDLPHIEECVNSFDTLKNETVSAVQQMQHDYTSLQHAAVGDEISIRQAWSELEELCIIDSEIRHRPVIEDRWLRELAYRRLIVYEKTGAKAKLQPILDNASKLDGQCRARMHEVLSEFLPKRRRLFLRTRELFDPAVDRLESGVAQEEDVTAAVKLDIAKHAEESEQDTATPQAQSGGFLASLYPSSPKAPQEQARKPNGKLEGEMTTLGVLLKSVHIYEVQIVSFRVEQNTWVTSFCVITYQQYMHFFPLLPGTNFETLRKEARPALAAACVAAWEKGSTPLLSVLLTSCSYGLSADGTFIELVIATPPRKKIGLRVGSPEECEQWVQKTQRWVMLFSMK